MNLNAINHDLGILYHGTKRSLLPAIMRDGLDPSKSVNAEDEEANDAEDFGPPYHFVYLSTSPKTAQSFAPGGEVNSDKDANGAAMLEVRLPPALQRQLITNRGEFVRAPFVIAPRYLRLMS